MHTASTKHSSLGNQYNKQKVQLIVKPFDKRTTFASLKFDTSILHNKKLAVIQKHFHVRMTSTVK